MELTKQVPQKDLCKRMLELGWDKETNISWYKYLFVPPNEMNKPFLLENSYWDSEDSWGMKSRLSKLYPAPTVAELGEALPHNIMQNKKCFEFEVEKYEGGYISHYTRRLVNNQWQEEELNDKRFESGFMANSMTKMWIYLKENKLI